MKKHRLSRQLALLISLLLLLTSTVHSTFGLITTKSESLKNTFIPLIEASVINDITVPITVEKTVFNTGTESIGPENFEFVLENVDTGNKQTLETDTNGLAVFDLTFSSEDIDHIYHYKLTETNDGREGVTYSTAVYYIEISVTLDENNKLAALVTFNDVVTEEYVAGFANIYHSGTTVAPPTSDNSNMIVWYILLIVTAIASILLYITRKRKMIIK